MRGLQTKDLGLFSKIVSKMEVKEEIMGMFTPIKIEGSEEMTEEEYEKALEKATDELEQKLGIEMMLVLVENYHKAEKEVYKLLANLTDKSLKEIEELSLKEFINLLQELVNDESIKDFFNLVAK